MYYQRELPPKKPSTSEPGELKESEEMKLAAMEPGSSDRP